MAVEIENVREQCIAAVRARVKIGEISHHFGPHLDKVYAFLRERSELRFAGAHNVFLYRGTDEPRRGGHIAVEFAVQVSRTFDDAGDIFCTATPAGRIATLTHVGPYHLLQRTHLAIQKWCSEKGHALALVDWEIYGDWVEDPARLETKVCYLLR